MGTREVTSYKTGGNSTYLLVAGNDPIEKEKLLIREEKRSLLEVCL